MLSNIVGNSFSRLLLITNASLLLLSATYHLCCKLLHSCMFYFREIRPTHNLYSVSEKVTFPLSKFSVKGCTFSRLYLGVRYI